LGFKLTEQITGKHRYNSEKKRQLMTSNCADKHLNDAKQILKRPS